MEKLKYEIPSIVRKQDALEFINEFYKYNSNINGTGSLDSYFDNYEEWLIKLEKDYNTEFSEERVPARTYFLVRENDNKIIGMINIRLTLNERLKKSGGHIGYCIRPTERRKGYNKINLYLGLKECQKYGIKEAMLTCDKTNLGSAKTMQSLGANLIEEFYEDNVLEQKYIISVDESIEKYKEEYEKFITKGDDVNENRNTKIKRLWISK